MTTATRSLPFDYGHRVLGHGGKCRTIHGHRGVAEITVKALNLDGLGMVIDFGAIKTLVGKWIDDNFDHRLLLHRDDPQLLHLQTTEEQPPYVMPNGNPTAENIARHLYDIAVELLPKNMEVVSVKVWETPNCFAVYNS